MNWIAKTCREFKTSEKNSVNADSAFTADWCLRMVAACLTQLEARADGSGRPLRMPPHVVSVRH